MAAMFWSHAVIAATVSLPTNNIGNQKYGHRFGSSEHKTKLKTTFISKGIDFLLHARPYDIDVTGEVEIKLNGVRIGTLPQTDDQAKGNGALWLLPASMQQAGTNTVTFAKVAGDDGRWGVSQLGLFRAGDARASFGNFKKRGYDRSHPQFVRLYVPAGGGNQLVGAKFYDVDSNTEVRVSVNGQSAGSPAVTANNKFGVTRYYDVPDGAWIEFRNLLAANEPMNWGVSIRSTERSISSSSIAGFDTISNSAWDQAAVRRVLRVFAWGGHAKDSTIRAWADMPPDVAITQMLNFKEHNALLSPMNSADRENYNGHGATLSSVRRFLGSSGAVPASERRWYKDDWSAGHSAGSIASLRGLNPFRYRIALWETNYHMAINVNAGVRWHQAVRYFDDVLTELSSNRPYQKVIAKAASSAAIAKQYAHHESRYISEDEYCECNEDFAREYYQLFFGILGGYDPELHETRTIKNMSRVLTGIQVKWTDALQAEPSVPVYVRDYHYRGDLPLLPGFTSFDQNNAKRRINQISDFAINHAESEANLPIKIIGGLADDNITDEKAAAIRTAWASMSEKNLLDFLRAYAISDTFHNPTRVKYWNSLDRRLIFNNAFMLTNREIFSRHWWATNFKDEGYRIFEPKHNVFGGQRGTEAARSSEIMRRVVNGSTQGLWFFTYDQETGGRTPWKRDWRQVLPKTNGRYVVKHVAEFLWNRFIGDELRNFGPVERAHVYSLLGSPYDLMQNLDPNDLERIVTVDDVENDAQIIALMRDLQGATIHLDANNNEFRKTARYRIGRAIAFISATPFSLAQEGI